MNYLVPFIVTFRKRATLTCALTLVLAACGEGAEETPFTPGVTPAVTGDSGATPAFDAGTAVVPQDSGTQVTPAPSDAQIGPRDGQVALDSTVARSDAQVSSGDGGGASDTGTPTPSGDSGVSVPQGDLGKGTGKDVVTLGDSWMLLVPGIGIQESLTATAMQPYRKYGFPATKVTSGDIPAQLESALRDDPSIKTVVMTGGGNDLILDLAGADCTTGGPLCVGQLDATAKALEAMWTKMSAAGVRDVIHVMYSAAAVANNPVKDLAVHNARLKQLCSSHPPMRCFQLNTDALAMDLLDGVHPLPSGYDAIGKAVFDLMVKEGMRR